MAQPGENGSPGIYTAMFPARMRKSPRSLSILSEARIIDWLICLVDRSSNTFWKNVVKHRIFLRRNLPAHLRSFLLDKLIPYYDELEDSNVNQDEWCKDIQWKYPCVLSPVRHSCKLHEECKVVWKRCDRILELVFSFDTNKLRLNFKKIRVEDHPNILSRILGVIQQPAPANTVPVKNTSIQSVPCSASTSKSIHHTPLITTLPSTNHMPQLGELSLAGGTVNTDRLLPQIEELSVALKDFAPALKKLRLPICSNYILKNLSQHPRLSMFVGDRSKHFDRRGLFHLCQTRSYTQVNLRVLHICVGVYSSKRHFNKLDAAKFLQAMQNLTTFSFMDETRKMIIRNGGHTTEREEREKVFVYSAFRLSIVDGELQQLEPPQSESTIVREENRSDTAILKLSQTNCNTEHVVGSFQTDLLEMKIVDRQLKPKYLLQSAPKLTSLYINWQEWLSEAPFHRFEAQWFSKMLLNDLDWIDLAARLTKLDIVFPSVQDPGAYGLPVADCGALVKSCPNLHSLRLVGAGLFAGPIPLLLVLQTCRKLRKLVLERSEIHFPRHLAQNIVSSNVNKCLKCFHYVGDVGNIAHIARNVANFMPNLSELRLEPLTHSFRFPGLLPKDVSELNVMRHLRNLSIPLAIHAFMMNMPEMVYVLRNFQSLRNLVLSWGSTEENYTYSSHRIMYMMRWLSNALISENANINVQLCFNVHQDIYIAVN